VFGFDTFLSSVKSIIYENPIQLYETYMYVKYRNIETVFLDKPR